MAEVETRDAGGMFEVLLDQSVVHTAQTPHEAQAVASWVAFQIGAGTSADDVHRMMTGQAPKKAQGFSGGLDVAPTAEEKAAEKAAAAQAKAEEKADEGGRRRRRRGSDDEGAQEAEAASDDQPTRRSRRAPKDEPAFDPEILEGRMTKLKKQVSDGEHDAYLADLLKAETDGKARLTLITAMKERMEEIG